MMIDIADANVCSAIEKLDDMFLTVVQCIEQPNLFGMAFVTKKIRNQNSTCELYFQYCHGNLREAHEMNYHQIHAAHFNMMMICGCTDKWPLITCFNVAGLHVQQHGLYDHLFPNSLLEKKIPLDFVDMVYLKDLDYQQRLAVSAIVQLSSFPLPYVVLGSCEYKMGDVVMEAVLQVADNDKNCLIVYQDLSQHTIELFEDLQQVSQGQFNLVMLRRCMAINLTKKPSVVFVNIFEGTEFCWCEQRPDFDHVMFLRADLMEEAFIFTTISGLSSMNQKQSRPLFQLTLFGFNQMRQQGMLKRLLESRIYNFESSNKENEATTPQVLQPQINLFKTEEFPGWISDLWEEYVKENEGNPNYVCRL
eukprot:TRINITY_DN8407_c0_g1_i1.p1 TRINITY_DN8407_c0_g1~~TRINITY_DN8407_c0_g1_i1.p1  ORF type:complete len:383 (+),score=18.32 TRINITY_DN8407_c0_g1_i1:62-1150(+)